MTTEQEPDHVDEHEHPEEEPAVLPIEPETIAGISSIDSEPPEADRGAEEARIQEETREALEDEGDSES